MPGYLDHWQQLHSADDITTDPIQPFHGIPTCPQELKRAIGYLKDYTRRLDVDLTHTSIQKGVLQAAFNAYRANAPKVTFDQIYAEALRKGSGDRYLNHLYTIKKWHVLQERIPIAESITLY